MAANDLLDDMKTTILELVDDLSESVFTSENEQGDLVMCKFYVKKLHPERIMKEIVNNVLQYDEMIQKRDEEFFLNNKSIFAGLPDDRINYYSRKLSSDEIDEDSKSVIWDYFDTITEIAKSYKKIV